MALVSGILTTENTLSTDLVGEWQEGVLERNARGDGTGAVLFAFMTRLAEEQADSHKYNWWERDPSRLSIYSSASGLAGASSLAFDDGAGGDVFALLSTGAILENDRTGERVMVTADPTTGTVNVARGIGITSGAAVNDNDLWTIVTKGSAENGTVRRGVFEDPENNYNFLQRFDETVELSDILTINRLRTDNDGPIAERRLQALERICNAIEFAYFDGVRDEVTTASGKVFLTGGIRDGIERAGLTTQILNGQGGTGVTIDTFRAWLHSFMINGSEQKIAFCGPDAYAAISSYANSQEAGFRFEGPAENVYGLHIQTIMTPYGMLDLAFHPKFKDSLAHRKRMYVCDLGMLRQKTGAKLTLHTGCEGNNEFGSKDNYRALLGLKMKFPAAFGYAYNLQLIKPNA